MTDDLFTLSGNFVSLLSCRWLNWENIVLLTLSLFYYPINKLLKSLKSLEVAKEDHISYRHNWHDDQEAWFWEGIEFWWQKDIRQTDRHTCNLESLSRLKIYLFKIWILSWFYNLSGCFGVWDNFCACHEYLHLL